MSTAMIVLTEAQASRMRGKSRLTPLAALDPMLLTDGRYILPAAVLSDPEHAEHHAELAARPTVQVDEIRSKLPIEEAPNKRV